MRLADLLWRAWSRQVCRIMGHEDSPMRPGTCLHCGTEIKECAH